MTQEAWRPTKEFLISTPRAAKLRDICVEVVKRLDVLLFDPQATYDQTRKSDVYVQLEMLNGQLIEEGVRSEIHVGRDEEFFQASPEACTEQVGGQLVWALGQRIVPIVQVRRATREFSSSDGPFTVVEQPFVKSIASQLGPLYAYRYARQMLDVDPSEIEFDEQPK